MTTRIIPRDTCVLCAKSRTSVPSNVCVYVCVCVCACVRACVRACVCVCARTQEFGINCYHRMVEFMLSHTSNVLTGVIAVLYQNIVV